MDELEKITVEELNLGVDGIVTIITSQYGPSWFVLYGKDNESKIIREQVIEVSDSVGVMDKICRKINGMKRPDTGRPYSVRVPFDKIVLMIRQADAAISLGSINEKILYKMVSTINDLRDEVEALKLMIKKE